MNVSIMLSAAAFVLCAAAFFYLRFFYRRNAAKQILADIREAVNQMVQEIDKATDRDALLVEDRVKNFRTAIEACEKKVTMILDEADRRIGVLSRELDSRQRRDEVYAELGKKAKLSPAQALKEDADEQKGSRAALSIEENIALLAARGFSAMQIADQLSITVPEAEMALFRQSSIHE